MFAEDPAVILPIFSYKQQGGKLYPRHASPKNKIIKIPKFYGLMLTARKQLKKESAAKGFSNLTVSNANNFKRLRPKARLIVKQQKKNSRRHFCSKVNSKTQTQMVWKAIRKTKGKGGSNSINHLKVNGKLITNKKQVAEAIATNLSNIL